MENISSDVVNASIYQLDGAHPPERNLDEDLMMSWLELKKLGLLALSDEDEARIREAIERYRQPREFIPLFH